MAEAEFKYDVFISYSYKDNSWVRGTLLPKLKARGLKVWIDFEKLPIGAPILTTIEKALMESRKVCLIFTENYLKSEWTEFENLLPQTRHPTNKELQIVPVLLEHCDLPPRLSALNYVNFVDKDEFVDPWKQLFAALGKPIRTTRVKPPTASRKDWCLKHPYSEIPDFTGRVKERQMLADWLRDNKHPLLVLKALGGFGKSALTWYWIKNDLDPSVWPKVVWWSFYDDREFSNFARETLEYLTGKPGNPTGTRQDVENLLNELENPGILLVLDGFERALRVFRSMDAAYQEDDKTKIENERDTDCVSPLAEDFLKGVSTLPELQGKVLMTTRLRPRILTGHGGILLTGCDEKELTALDRADAVDFFHHIGINGTRAEIQSACEPYGYHPLSLRLLSGLIVKDFEHPRDISVAQKFNIIGDLKQRQHHVLEQSYNSLTPERQRLFSRIACFRGSIDYKALKAIAEKEATFDDDIHDLVERGLLHHTELDNKFDLHPIVRRFAYDRLTAADRRGAHQRLVNYFEAVPKMEKVGTLEDLAPVIELYHHMVRAGKLDEAIVLFRDRLNKATYYQFGAYQLRIELMLALFPDGEDKPPRLNDESAQAWTLNGLANSYALSGQPRRAVPLFEMANDIYENKMKNKGFLAIGLGNVASMAQIYIGALREAERNLRRYIELSRELGIEEENADGYAELGRVLTYQGQWNEANSELEKAFRLEKSIQYQSVIWSYRAQRFLLMRRADPQSSTLHRQSSIESASRALELADEDTKRRYPHPRDYVGVHWLLGAAHRANGELTKAEENLSKAISMCRQINLVEEEANILLNLARLRYDQENYEEAKSLADEALTITERSGYVLQGADVNLFLAQYALEQEKDKAKAKEYAQTALKLARCDGPPYYYKVAYEEAERLLEKLK